MRYTIPAVLIGCALLTSGCREGDGPGGPGGGDVAVFFQTDPPGARIIIDNNDTGFTTPDTVMMRRGDRTVLLRLDSAGHSYTYGALLRVVRSDSVPEFDLPLALQCAPENGACFNAARRMHDAAGMRFAASAIGSLMQGPSGGQGLTWPAGSNTYVATGLPVFGAMANNVPVATGVYDQSMFAGRPAPVVVRDGPLFTRRQTAWIVPPRNPLVSPATARGIEVEQEIVAHDDVEGVIIVRLTFRNISSDPRVHLWAPHIPAGSVTYNDAFIGFAMDPDIGSPSDDWMSYDADLDMVFAYDANFLEQSFAPTTASPGLVGLRVLEAPEGTTVLMNGWGLALNAPSDWNAGTQSQQNGYGMLSGSAVYTPAHPHPRIGHLPPGQRDVRIVVSAGPLTLEPGDEAQIVVAIAVALPTPGTFTSGSANEPGDPVDPSRPLYATASQLRDRMHAAAALNDATR